VYDIITINPVGRGVSYNIGDTEIGSIVVRPEHIAFIAGHWCQQISKRAKRIEIVNLAREHRKHMSVLIKKHLSDCY